MLWLDELRYDRVGVTRTRADCNAVSPSFLDVTMAVPRSTHWDWGDPKGELDSFDFRITIAA